MDNISEVVRLFILRNFAHNDDSINLTPSTDLRQLGLLDSLSVLTLLEFLEERFHLEFEAGDLDGDSFSSLANIERLVTSKLDISCR